MKIGQPAELVSDLYGKQIVYRGRVAGFSAGTGSAFSLIPAQNATGNWIKVVQRVPVRIVLNREDVDRHPLRIGLSMTVKVDTSAAGAPVSKRRVRHCRKWKVPTGRKSIGRSMKSSGNPRPDAV